MTSNAKQYQEERGFDAYFRALEAIQDEEMDIIDEALGVALKNGKYIVRVPNEDPEILDGGTWGYISKEEYFRDYPEG